MFQKYHNQGKNGSVKGEGYKNGTSFFCEKLTLIKSSSFASFYGS